MSGIQTESIDMYVDFRPR